MTTYKVEESDDELREALIQKFKTRGPTGAWERDDMRELLVQAMANPDKVNDKRLVWVFSMVFGTMTQTLEAQQVQQMMLSMDKQFEKEREEREKDRAENKSEHRFFKYGIMGIAIASGFLGILSEEMIVWIAGIFGM